MSTTEASPFGWYVYRLLEDASKVTKTYALKGADWDIIAQVWKIKEEADEVLAAATGEDGENRGPDGIAEEISDVIFAALTAGHLLNIDNQQMQKALRRKLGIIQQRAEDWHNPRGDLSEKAKAKPVEGAPES